MNFFALCVGRFEQYRFAWFEVPEASRYGDPPTCPSCRRPIGSRTWLPPHAVALKQTRRVGDFVGGAGGCEFLCQARVVASWRAHGLSGMDDAFPVQISRMGTTSRSNASPRPSLVGVKVPHTMTRVDHSRMDVEWASAPEAGSCRTCGPGGGGRGGIIRRWQRVVIDAASWNGEDLFIAVNLSGVVLVSERAAAVIHSEGWSNVATVPVEQFRR